MSTPQELRAWLRVVDSRHVRSVTLLIPDERAHPTPWAQISAIATWWVTVDGLEALYVEDLDGCAWHQSGQRCKPPAEAEMCKIWSKPRGGNCWPVGEFR